MTSNPTILAPAILWPAATALSISAALFAIIANLLCRRRLTRQLQNHLKDQATLQAMIQQMPAVVWTIDHNLRFTSSDGAALRELQSKPNSVVGKSLYEYFGTDDPAFEPIAHHLAALKGQSSTYELTWSTRTFLAHVEPLRDAAGQIIGAVGVAFDITRRKTAEDALANTQALHEALLTAIPDIMFRARGDGTLTQFVDNLLAPSPTHAGANLRETFPPEVADLFLEAAQKVLATHAAQMFEYQTGAGRQKRFFEARVVGCLKDEVLVILRNITQRRQAQDDLRQRQAEHATLLRAMPDQIFQITRDGRIAGVVSYHDEYLAVPADQMIGAIAISFCSPEIGAEFTHCLNNAFATGETQVMQYTLEVKGKPTWYEARLVLNPSNPDQVLSFVRNITHLRDQIPSMSDIA